MTLNETSRRERAQSCFFAFFFSFLGRLSVFHLPVSLSMASSRRFAWCWSFLRSSLRMLFFSSLFLPFLFFLSLSFCSVDLLHPLPLSLHCCSTPSLHSEPGCMLRKSRRRLLGSRAAAAAAASLPCSAERDSHSRDRHAIRTMHGAASLDRSSSDRCRSTIRAQRQWPFSCSRAFPLRFALADRGGARCCK